MKNLRQKILHPKDLKIEWSQNYLWFNITNLRKNHLFCDGEKLESPNPEWGACHVYYKKTARSLGTEMQILSDSDPKKKVLVWSMFNLVSDKEANGKYFSKENSKGEAVKMQMKGKDTITMTLGGNVVEWTRSRLKFETIHTVLEGEIFEHKVMGKFEAIYEENQKFLTFRALEPKAGVVKIRSNGWQDLKKITDIVDFKWQDPVGFDLPLKGSFSDIRRFCIYSGGKSAIFERKGYLISDLSEEERKKTLEIIEMDSPKEYENVSLVGDEEIGSKRFPDRCDMVLLRDGTKNWNYKKLPDGVEINWAEKNPLQTMKSIKSDKKNSGISSKIDENAIPIRRPSSINLKLSDKVKIFNKSFGQIPEKTAGMKKSGIIEELERINSEEI